MKKRDALGERRRRETLAADRAELYAPRPSGGARMAGVCGACLAIMTQAGISAFYSWRIADHAWLALALAAIGFLVGFIGYIRVQGANISARRDELQRIEAEANPEVDGRPE